jgi:hypothetical protein
MNDDDNDNNNNTSSKEEKYPRTPHFPFSPGINSDDIVTTKTLDIFFPSKQQQVDIHISEKLDGGNCCLKQGQVFARTHGKPATHESFSAVKALYHTIIIPQLSEEEFEQLEFFGENMAAVHSIHYSADPKFPLPSVFFLFAIRHKQKDCWLSVDDVAEIAERLGIEQPPVLFRGVPKDDQFVEKLIQENMKLPSILATKVMKSDKPVPVEGFVARNAASFSSKEFEKNVSKCVRANHIQCEDKVFKTQWTRANFMQ